MSNEDENEAGEFNPSGGVPSHPADPQFGDKDKDDAYDASDEAEDDTETE